MARIGHRCACGHSDLHHPGIDNTTNGGCRAAAGAPCGRPCAPNDPEVLPTFDIKGRPIERIIPPGEALLSEGGVPIVRTCGCDDCCALYEQLANAA